MDMIHHTLDKIEARLKSDKKFAADRSARLNWFYERTPFADSNRYLYPVGVVR